MRKCQYGQTWSIAPFSGVCFYSVTIQSAEVLSLCILASMWFSLDAVVLYIDGEPAVGYL